MNYPGTYGYKSKINDDLMFTTTEKAKKYDCSGAAQIIGLAMQSDIEDVFSSTSRHLSLHAAILFAADFLRDLENERVMEEYRKAKVVATETAIAAE